jgi:SAM-dependent methyltransferase
MAQFARFVLDPGYRAERRLYQTAAGRAFQITGVTFANRYPVLFDAIAEALSDRPAPRILSLGCSTGEELAALRARLPQAEIVGIDINRHSLGRARRLLNDPGIRLIHADSAQVVEPETFDAILALAVFQRSELNRDRPEVAGPHLSFARVEAEWRALDRALKPGGLLALTNANYRFADSGLYEQYTVILRQPVSKVIHPDYGPDDRLIAGPKYGEILFRKHQHLHLVTGDEC